MAPLDPRDSGDAVRVESTVMFGFLALGFLIGLRHALEADHVAKTVSD